MATILVAASIEESPLAIDGMGASPAYHPYHPPGGIEAPSSFSSFEEAERRLLVRLLRPLLTGEKASPPWRHNRGEADEE